MFIEQKFIHEAGLAGHIEDVVVSKECRGMSHCVLCEQAVTRGRLGAWKNHR